MIWYSRSQIVFTLIWLHDIAVYVSHTNTGHRWEWFQWLVLPDARCIEDTTQETGPGRGLGGLEIFKLRHLGNWQQHVKQVLFRYLRLYQENDLQKVRDKVICGGSGSLSIRMLLAKGADVYITGTFTTILLRICCPMVWLALTQASLYRSAFWKNRCTLLNGREGLVYWYLA